MNGWAKIKRGAEYGGVKERTFREWLKMGLPHSRIRGTVLVKFSDIDEFLRRFSENSDQMERIVEQCLKDFE